MGKKYLRYTTLLEYMWGSIRSLAKFVAAFQIADV